MKKLSKTEAEKEIRDIENKTPKEIKKIKRLAMRHNIKIGELRKKFCKKCFSTKLKIISIKNKIKKIGCESCGNVARWKMKS